MPDVEVDDDPFEAFGKEEEDADDKRRQLKPCDGHGVSKITESIISPLNACPSTSTCFSSSTSTSSSSTAKRPLSNGVLVFHAGTEHALLQFVKHHLYVHENQICHAYQSDRPCPLRIRRCEKILALIDAFCLSIHWMMHIGNEKGAILDQFLIKRLRQLLPLHQSHNMGNEKKKKPFWILELGTYCGYSALRMVKTCLQYRCQHDDDFHCTVVTVDVNTQFHPVARELLFQIAGLEPNVSLLLLNKEDSGSSLSQSIIQHLHDIDHYASSPPPCGFDFVFLDHDKDLYLRDVRELEDAGLICAQTFVCADNVVFFRLDAYRRHMQGLADRGIVSTRLHLSTLEYVVDNGESSSSTLQEDDHDMMNLQDGLELTEYLSDPKSAQMLTNKHQSNKQTRCH